MKHSASSNGDSGLFLTHKKHVCVWLLALCVPLAFIYFSSSPSLVPPHSPSSLLSQTPRAVTRASGTADDVGSDSLEVNVTDGISESRQPAEDSNGECDLSTGEWVKDISGPSYTNETCFAIQDHQNCMRNGRPDTEYLYWRWKPRGCELPKFNATNFLNIVRSKTLAFIGDSIGRNHMQSLVCLLSQAEIPSDLYKDSTDKFRRWYFPSYNFTLAVLWSAFFVKEKGTEGDLIKLEIDVADEKWTSQLHEFDIVLLAGGQWFPKASLYLEKNEVIGCHHCPGTNYTELGFYFAYRKALRLALKTIYTSSDYKGLTFLRTFTPDHFENGRWDNGGNCIRQVPYKSNEIALGGISEVMYKIQLDEYEKAAKEAAVRGLKFRLISTTWASLLRPDGHPGPYRYPNTSLKDKAAKLPNDCLHWCLPGPIDTWNEFLLEMLRREYHQ